RIHLAALAIREETIGTDHFHTSHTYHNLAVVYRGMEQWPEAEQFYREALRVKQIHHGEGSAETGRTLSQLGHAIGMQGRFEEASRLHDAAVATTRGLDAETGSLVAPMLVRRGDVLRAEGRLTDAETSIRRGIRLWQRSVGTPTPLVPRWLLRLSEVVGTQGRQEEATQLVAESRALCDGLPLERQRDRCISAAEAAL
ncbi:MAG: tetratricopeptide repeat protein, partial [Bacteroidota bacterium]